MKNEDVRIGSLVTISGRITIGDAFVGKTGLVVGTHCSYYLILVDEQISVFASYEFKALK